MKKIIIPIVAIAVFVNVTAYFLLHGPARPADPELSQPVLAQQAMQAKNAFTVEHSKQYLDAAQNPDEWRKLDRSAHFDAVILTGDPATYRPLLDHLLHAHDWTLVYLDHTSFGFKRAPIAGWDAASLKDLEARFENRPVQERVDFLVQLAGKLMCVDEEVAARRLLEQAVKLDEHSAPAWSQLAAYFAQSSLWGPALQDAENALKTSPDYPPALQVKMQVLLAMNRADDALPVARQVLKADPQNPQILYQFAEVAHQAHDYQGEIAALRNLVDMAAQAKRPAAGYRIYLGQAYSRNGQRIEALEQFQQALDSGELSAEQVDYAKEAVRRLGGAVEDAGAAQPAQ